MGSVQVTKSALLLLTACLALPVQATGQATGAASPVVDWDRTIKGSPLIMTGFVDVRAGVRTQGDSEEQSASLGEIRTQLEFFRDREDDAYKLVADILIDPVQDQYAVDLERGTGILDLREANYIGSVSDAIDVKLGRQILTWGTGDLLFINDMFPKDWNSFFIGRDTEYLKAPSDALKASFYDSRLNADVVYTPRFDADRYIDGERISFYNPALGRITGDSNVVRAKIPNDWFSDDEVALRLHRIIKGYEFAAYGYDGFWKSPGGMDPVTGKVVFPRLRVFGASVRGYFAGGVAYAELGDYRSRDDSGGDNPLIRNGEYRALIGYERELAHELTGGLQYYLEHMKDYSDYKATLPAGSPRADENRHVVTLRLTQLLMHQNLELSLFIYHSPSDDDGYVRPKAKYKLDDSWLLEAGANIFYGNENHTFFGQFENNTNIYIAARYGF